MAKAKTPITPQSLASHAVRLTELEKAVKALKTTQAPQNVAPASAATSAVAFEWSPSSGATWVKLDGQELMNTPSTRQLTAGTHALEYMFAGAPKTAWHIVITGAKFPTAPIAGTIPDEGFVAGYVYVLV